MLLSVDPDQAFHERVAGAVRGTRWATAITAVTTITEALDVLRSPAAGIAAVLGGPGLGFDDGVLLAEQTVRLSSGTAVLLVAEPTTDRLRRAMRAGARDVLSPSFDRDELTAALSEAGVGTSGPAPLPGLTVAVLGVKGGVGASVVASNLAIRLADSVGSSVTLADLDLASADLAVMHGVSARWTIQDMADGTVGLDVDSLRDVLHRIGDKGARLLPGPVDPALAERITADDVSNLVALLRSEAPLVVLDLATSFDDRTLAAIDAADMIVLTAGLDVASLRGLAVSLRTLQQLGVADDQLRVVLVRADSKAGLTTGDVERTIGRPIDIKVPSTRAVPRSVNEGVPLALSSSRSGVVQAIDELVADIAAHLPAGIPTHDEGTSTGRRRFLGRPRDEAPDGPGHLETPPPVGEDLFPDDAPAPEDVADANADVEAGDEPQGPEGSKQARPRVVRRARPSADGGGEVLYLAGTDLESMPPPAADDDGPGHLGGRARRS